jgi:condensin-2 complex subunit D3
MNESMLYFNHFVEAVFHLNNYTGHRDYNQLRAFHPGVEPSAFAFAGSLVGNDGDKKKRRMALYSLMLSGMSQEHKLQVALKLTQEVLAAVADGDLPLVAASDVVQDTLAILVSKEIKVGSGGSEDEDGTTLEKPEPTSSSS